MQVAASLASYLGNTMTNSYRCKMKELKAGRGTQRLETGLER